MIRDGFSSNGVAQRRACARGWRKRKVISFYNNRPPIFYYGLGGNNDVKELLDSAYFLASSAAFLAASSAIILAPAARRAFDASSIALFLAARSSFVGSCGSPLPSYAFQSAALQFNNIGKGGKRSRQHREANADTRADPVHSRLALLSQRGITGVRADRREL